MHEGPMYDEVPNGTVRTEANDDDDDIENHLDKIDFKVKNHSKNIDRNSNNNKHATSIVEGIDNEENRAKTRSS